MVLRLMPTGLALFEGMVVNEQILKLPLLTIRDEHRKWRMPTSGILAPQEYSLGFVDLNIFTWSMSKMHIRTSWGALIVAAQCRVFIGHADLPEQPENTGILTDSSTGR
ncbi:unnamed protein product, partial [Mesorhabditis belari]|uniref:Uncharacterized protein n=1 Tax=Mesorhabditis belari TaxID=2138241 RepID=A0AAF3FNP0_9BILA